MLRSSAQIGLLVLLSSPFFGQPAPGQAAAANAGAVQTETPTFELADVHVSPHRTTQGTRGAILRNSGRYEFTNATMVDLIRIAYDVDADKVLGGPSWLESDRFDIFAQVPPKTSQETARLMLQALLADRFKLMLHKDSHSMPTYALSVSKDGHKLKEASGSGEPECKMTIQQNSPAEAAAIQNALQNGGPVTLRVTTFLFSCHGMTMAAFAGQMHTMIVAPSYVGNNPIADRTGLKGSWDFDFKYTIKPPTNGNAPLIGTANGVVQATVSGEYISLFDAMDKQLGLKLDAVTLPIPVILVDSVNRKPADNPPEVTAKLPPPPKDEFEVAEIRLTPPGATSAGSRGFQPNGQLDLRAYPLKSLIIIGWDINGGADALADAPKWLDNAKVDLIAKLTPSGPPNQGIDIDALRPAVRALLQDRFKARIHTEMRPGTVWVMTAPKPKLAKADPLMRTLCKEGPGKDGKDPRTASPVLGRLLTCQNMTMAEFAEELPRRAGGYFTGGGPVIDETGLTDSYDFTLSFSVAQLIPGSALSNAIAGGGIVVAGGRGGDGANPNDPTGAISLQDALGKQLGLKLEQQKRPVPTAVLDHIEEKPTE